MPGSPDRVVPLVTGSILRPGAPVRLDAHSRAWTDPPSLAPEPLPARNDEARQVAALGRFAVAAAPRRAALLDGHPPGSGRNAAALARLSAKTGVAIAAVTGFDPNRHYPKGLRPWTTETAALGTFLRELEGGLREQPPARAAAVKTAYAGESLDGDPCWEAAVTACRETDALLMVQSESGAGVERLIEWLDGREVPPERVYLCGIDARPDRELHSDLARAGVLLGFDGVLTHDGDPTSSTLPLLERLLDDGHADAIAIGLGGGAHGGRGPEALVTVVADRLAGMAVGQAELDAMLGGSLLARAARPETP
jgi:5-phospho-D-xylono-1,4-lactonase